MTVFVFLCAVVNGTCFMTGLWFYRQATLRLERAKIMLDLIRDVHKVPFETWLAAVDKVGKDAPSN